MLPKPSLVLQVRLRPEEYSDTAAAEIKRSYMYLAQSVVSELDEGERAEGNLMRLNVRLMKPFWDASDPAAEQLWRASFMPWLVNATRNMSTAMHNYNTVLHPLGAGNVTYQWADFDFAPHAVLRLKVDDENRIPSEAPALCDKVRTLAAEGVFDENVARIRIPSRASIAAQEAAFEEEQARYRAALVAQDEDAEDEAAVPAETAAEGEGSFEADEAAVVTEDIEELGIAQPSDLADDAAADATTEAPEPWTITTKDSDFSTELQNILDEQFNPDRPNAVWCSDITYIWTIDGFVYLTSIMDLFSRKIIAWTLSKTLEVSCVIDTINKAKARRNIDQPLIIHSDRGSQYVATEYKKVTENMQRSYSKKAFPWDNACIESFHSIIKREWLNRFKIHDYKQAYRLIFEYLEAFYNTKRIHSHCNYMSPNEFERLYKRTHTEAELLAG